MDEIKSFGSYLNELLNIKGIDKKQFAATININRSLLYRFLSSEQLPDPEQLYEISEKLYLRASEHRKLLESYECTQYGWEIVKGRKLITDMLTNIDKKKNVYNITYDYNLKHIDMLQENVDVFPIKNKINVINTVLYLLDYVRQNTDVSNVNIILQPDIPNFVNVLSKILNEITESNRIVLIKHIIRFKDTLLKKNKLYNLEVLNYMIPLSFFQSVYNVYYTTGTESTEAYDTFFPNFISLDSNTTFVFSDDYEHGILYTAKCSEIIKLMNEEFKKISIDCLPLFINLQTLEKQSYYMYEYEQIVQANTSLLHPENGFYTLPTEIVNTKAADGYIPKELAQLLIKRMKAFRERLNKGSALEIISLAGLRNFAETGQPLIFKSIICSKSERIEILKSLLRFVEEAENYNLYLMKEDNPFYECDFAVYTIGSELLYIVPSYTDFNITDNIIIRNRGIVESFTDFLNSSFTAQNSIIDRKEVAAVISQIIDDIKTAG